ncbi:MAG: A24 family peptidase [Gammaproteobacteria bacterium]|nr:A24 family peptidase [Gammaproteobacteria bacterium]
MLIEENFLVIWPLLVILAIATYTDVKAHRISNLLSFGGVITGLVLHGWILGLDGLFAGLGGALLGFAVLLPLYMLGGMAAGDVKLMAAVGAFLGPESTFNALIFTLIAGMIMGIFMLILHGELAVWCKRYLSTAKYSVLTGQLNYVPPSPGDTATKRFPYAAAIATGTFVSIFGHSLISKI